MKELKDLAWNVDEETYRKDRALSYSMLSTFQKSGFRGLKRMIDGERTETKQLAHGSAVDCLLTQPDKFDEYYLVADFKEPSDDVKAIADAIWEEVKSPGIRADLNSIDAEIIVRTARGMGYGASNWKDETIAKKIIESANDYFSFKPIEDTGKTIISQWNYDKAQECVHVLRSHPFTKWIFEESDTVKVYYQLKFKISRSGNIYRWKDELLERDTLRCMLDIVVVDYKNKWIMPFDLKTTGKNEEDFILSIQDWNYDIQATLYWDILWDVIKNDDEFCDFSLVPFAFIPINKDNLCPQIFRYITKGNTTTIREPKFIDYKGNPHYSWQDLANEVQWHINNDEWNYSRKTFLQEGLNLVELE